MAGWIETRLLDEPWDVDRRITELGLTKEGLVNAVQAARTASGNATALHPSNAAGTFGYHEGIAALRQEFIGEEWVIDRKDGVETIRNDRLCCTNPVGDSSRESSVVAGGHEQTHTPRLQDQELARL